MTREERRGLNLLKDYKNLPEKQVGKSEISKMSIANRLVQTK